MEEYQYGWNWNTAEQDINVFVIWSHNDSLPSTNKICKSMNDDDESIIDKFNVRHF